MVNAARGRKRTDDPTPNRARDIQRAFRARRAAHLESLENRIRELEEENTYFRSMLSMPPANRPALGKGPTGRGLTKSRARNDSISSSGSPTPSSEAPGTPSLEFASSLPPETFMQDLHARLAPESTDNIGGEISFKAAEQSPSPPIDNNVDPYAYDTHHPIPQYAHLRSPVDATKRLRGDFSNGLHISHDHGHPGHPGPPTLSVTAIGSPPIQILPFNMGDDMQWMADMNLEQTPTQSQLNVDNERLFSFPNQSQLTPRAHQPTFKPPQFMAQHRRAHTEPQSLGSVIAMSNANRGYLAGHRPSMSEMDFRATPSPPPPNIRSSFAVI